MTAPACEQGFHWGAPARRAVSVVALTAQSEWSSMDRHICSRCESGMQCHTQRQNNARALCATPQHANGQQHVPSEQGGARWCDIAIQSIQGNMTPFNTRGHAVEVLPVHWRPCVHRGKHPRSTTAAVHTQVAPPHRRATLQEENNSAEETLGHLRESGGRAREERAMQQGCS